MEYASRPARYLVLVDSKYCLLVDHKAGLPCCIVTVYHTFRFAPGRAGRVVFAMKRARGLLNVVIHELGLLRYS